MSIVDVQDLTVDLMAPHGVWREDDGGRFDIESVETLTIIGE